jgi:8-oxo-dGTP pyrophosphatase MutT (NUDIX family)
MDPYAFQYCQKIVVLSEDGSRILLAKRQGEQDYDGAFAFIGGKMEITDESIAAGLKREKDEEIGEQCKVRILPTHSFNLLYRKVDGKSMILPHYLAYFESGEITLSNEYSEYRWINIEDLDAFEPKIPNIPEAYRKTLELKKLANPDDFIIL